MKTGEVRLSYVTLIEPRAMEEGQDKKYSVQVLLPKTDKATKKELDAIIEAARAEGVKTRFNGKKPNKMVQVKDGDDEDAFTTYNQEYAGNWVFSASNKRKPIILDTDNKPVMDERDVYSGCYARLALKAFPFNAAEGRAIGVSISLDVVKKTRDGDPLDGSITADAAAEMFEDDDL